MNDFFGIFNRTGEDIDSKVVDTLLDAVSYWKPDENNAYVLTMDTSIDNSEELIKEI